MSEWQKPVPCSGADCPEYRYVGGRVEIRDSARPAEVAWFRQEAWEAFVEALSTPRSLPGFPTHAGTPTGPAVDT